VFLFRVRPYKNKCQLRCRLFLFAGYKKGSTPISLYQKEKDWRFLWLYNTQTMHVCQYPIQKNFKAFFLIRFLGNSLNSTYLLTPLSAIIYRPPLSEYLPV